MFIITTSTLAIRLGLFPRWMALLGYALALFQILSVGYVYWAPVVFPLWVFLVSVLILVANLRPAPAGRRTDRGPGPDPPGQLLTRA